MSSKPVIAQLHSTASQPRFCMTQNTQGIRSKQFNVKVVSPR